MGPTGVAQVELALSVRAVDFISDLHLSADLPRTVGAFERYLSATRADALFILGDLFEAWVGDDLISLPFEGHCVAALADIAAHIPVFVMHGNRDFLLGDTFYRASGCRPLPDPCRVTAHGGEAVLLSHGDALCLDDVPYQQFRAEVRTPEWSAAFLARPLDERRQIGAQMRAASRANQRRTDPVTFADADGPMATRWLAEAGASILVHGHTHRPASEQRPEGWQRHVLSDWDCDHATPARAEVLRWTPGRFDRLAPGVA
jgi:UDP-2,3-diacylglucosamine hydrolase